MGEFIIIGIILIVLGLTIFQRWRWRKSLQSIDRNRPFLDREDYITNLIDKGFDRKDIEVVYDEINKFIRLKGFSLYPVDDLHKLYRIEDLDDIELIDLICDKLNVQKAEQEDIDLIGKNYNNFTAEFILSLIKYLKEENPCSA